MHVAYVSLKSRRSSFNFTLPFGIHNFINTQSSAIQVVIIAISFGCDPETVYVAMLW